ncbi:alpha-actinin [Umbelopsis nana]
MSYRNSYQPSAASQQQVEDTAKIMDKTWEVIQQKTFTKWVNNKLDIQSIPHIDNLGEDIANGVRLIQLLEIIGDTPLGRYNKNPKMRIQKVENVNKALEFIKLRGVALTNIGAEDIVDTNAKLILGMIWTIILRFTIADINQEGLTAKEGLLLWCQRKTAPYDDVNVRDFTYSWTDGLAFCALIHRHRPDLLDYHSLDKSDRHGNTALAFDVAEQHLGIPKLLDVEDVCDIQKPDERSVMTYVAEYFHAFSNLDKVETAGRRVAQFAEVMASVWEMQNDYERRVLALMEAVESKQQEWKGTSFTNSYLETKQKSTEFTTYKNTDKRTWVAEKQDLDTLLGNIQTKLKTYDLAPYVPPAGLTLADLDKKWKGLLDSEANYHRSINGKLREIKENLRKSYAQAANDFQKQLNATTLELVKLDGDLDIQLNRVQTITGKLQPLQSSLQKIAELDRQCEEANTEENDYTIYSVEDLKFELTLVQKAVQKKSAFIENQIVSRNMTNLTPAQLEEFESTFRYFDKDNSNSLSVAELSAAIASLGFFYEDKEFDRIFSQIAEGQSEASFEQFIHYMVSVTEDKATPEQLCQSFRAIAGDKPYVTELDLKMCMVPVPVIETLKQTMPKSNQDGYDYTAWVNSVFK